jgi:hypothetical protein
MKFPKRATIYVHGSDETMWDLATKLGFKEGSDAHGMARHSADEFEIVLEFQSNGRASIVSVNDLPIEKQVPLGRLDNH